MLPTTSSIINTLYQNYNHPKVIKAGLQPLFICGVVTTFCSISAFNDLKSKYSLKDKLSLSKFVSRFVVLPQLPIHCAIIALAMINEALSLKR